MEEITEKIKQRKNYSSIVTTMKDYKVFKSSNGEEFTTMSAAKKYQKEHTRMIEFKKHFNFSKGNLKRGTQKLADRLFKRGDIIDYFWINPTEDNLGILRDFLYKHYKIGPNDASGLCIVCNEWNFISIRAKLPGSSKYTYNNIVMCRKNTLTEEIKTLESLVPDFSKEEEYEDESCEEESSKFDMLDIRED